MFLSRYRNTALALALSLMPTFSVAQDAFGTLTARLDGVERTWFLTALEEESQSFGMTVTAASMKSFSLWGQPTAETVAEVKDSLLLGFDVMTVGGSKIPLNVSLTYLADGWKSGWLANEEDQIVFSLTTLEEVGGGLFVEGSFTAAAHYSDTLVSGQVDPSQTMQIEGSFSATLPKALLKDQ
ncbi:hypothetical protein TG4357_01541 [Thalassovita gelatinovora]|uniref:Lipid/polyisoprenoid-binding YceI-like domain-containing protein n=2 Tax=Thalassovita gelatinovora TaxID=53501 RepID=A0A0P1FAL1_THAGE|nr:hypothetical protein TG4357_01541 [Thalassovita gelatinovora]SEP90720.1 hypothetical protein SAMN04488043_102134 [Thalassovita gelatinovora]